MAKKKTSVPPKPINPTFGMWIAAARVRTLSLAVAPVALGTATASLMNDRVINFWLVGLCLAVALFLQIGVNYANDYSDGVRGTDAFRVGPARLTAVGIAHPKRVLLVAGIFFVLAAFSGLALSVITGCYWLLVIGAIAIAAGYFYSGGKRPYGYYGLGELVVFLFFGLVATMGTEYILSADLSSYSLWSGCGIGALACAVLMVNNIRDRETDKQAGKKTLAVLLGQRFAKVLYIFFIVLAYAVLVAFSLLFPKALLVFFTALIAVPAMLIVATAKTAQELILALKLTSFLSVVYGLGLAWAIAF